VRPQENSNLSICTYLNHSRPWHSGYQCSSTVVWSVVFLISKRRFEVFRDMQMQPTRYNYLARYIEIPMMQRSVLKHFFASEMVSTHLSFKLKSRITNLYYTNKARCSVSTHQFAIHKQFIFSWIRLCLIKRSQKQLLVGEPNNEWTKYNVLVNIKHSNALFKKTLLQSFVYYPVLSIKHSVQYVYQLRKHL